MSHWPMDKVKEQPFSCVKELITYLENNFITRSVNYGFRGQNNSSWELKTTFVRFLEGISKSNPRFNKIEARQKLLLRKLQAQFKENLIVNDDIGQEQAEKVNLWEFGQHFGLPSPLLDWTDSPYIGLFFALSKPSQESEERCIFVLDRDILERLNEDIEHSIWPKIRKNLDETLTKEQYPILEVIRNVEQQNKRIAFQQGFFTKLEYYKSVEVWLKRVVGELTRNRADRPIIQKLIFKCNEEERLATLDRLDKMNINYRTLFPDIEGSVKHAIERTYRDLRTPPIKSFSFSAVDS